MPTWLLDYNNHFFAFFNSYWCVDDILPRWEVAIGLAFSESKMATKIADTYNICISEHIFCSRHSRMMVLVSKGRLFMDSSYVFILSIWSRLHGVIPQ